MLQKEVESVQAAWTSSHLQEGNGNPAGILCLHSELLIFSSLFRTAVPVGLPPTLCTPSAYSMLHLLLQFCLVNMFQQKDLCI